MAKVTSSSERAKRRARKPVTTAKGRGNRQGASNAQVTQGGTRGSGQPRVTNAAQRTRTGSAPVTGGSRPALPPGRPNRSRSQPVAPPPRGPARPSIGNVSGPASSPNRPSAPARPPTGRPARPSIGNVSGPASSPNRPSAPARPPTGRPARPSIGNVSGPASSPNRPSAPARPPTGGVSAAVRTGAKGLSRVPGPVGKIVGGTMALLQVADAIRGFSDPNDPYNRAIQNVRDRFARKPGNRPSGDAVRNGSFIGGGDTRETSAASRRSGGRGVSPGAVRPSAAPARPSKGSGGTNPPSSGSSRPAGAQSSGSARPSSSAPARPSSSAPARPSSSAVPQAKASATKAKSGSYGKDGKQLYNADKKDNPLMARTFGYQAGEGPGQEKDRGPVKGTGPVKSGDSYAKKLVNKGNKRGAGRAASAGAKSSPVTTQGEKEREILDRIKRLKEEAKKK